MELVTVPEVATESWRIVWRGGFVPVLSDAHLEALRDALLGDDQRLTQGSTTTPPPLLCVQDWPVEAACALGFCGWQGDDLESVGQVEEFFARACFDADQRLGAPAACRHFLNAFDSWPRNEMIRNLLPEVEYALALRGVGSSPDPLDARVNGVGQPGGLQKVGGKWKRVLLHRFILGSAAGSLVDHEDGDGLNNTRPNLRSATRGQNQHNSGPRSGRFKGVTWHKKAGKWRAQIMADRKYRYLGLFATEDAAARAYDAAAKELHGDFAWLNFPEVKT